MKDENQLKNKAVTVLIATLMILAYCVILSPNVRAAYDVYVDDNAAPGWYDATHVHTIQEGINNATSGQSIYVYGGTYVGSLSGSTYLLITTKTLTIVGQSTDMPIINPKMSNTSAQYIFQSTGTGYSLTLQYLNMSDYWGGNTSAVNIGVYITGQNNVVVDHCIIHDIETAAKVSGNATFTNNTVYHFKHEGLYSTASSYTHPLHFICKYNIIYDSVVKSGASWGGINNEAIKPKYGCWYGDISYNYIAGCRIGIWLDPESGNHLCQYGGNWTVSHNTIVSKYASLNPGNMTNGIAFSSVDNNFTKINCRDNLISGTYQYAMYHGGYNGLSEPYTSNITIKNCLFYDSYKGISDSLLPQKYFQWNASGYSANIKYGPSEVRPVLGWPYNTTTDHLFYVKNCIVADPKFNLTGTPGPQYWGLQAGSPALNAASDGTNIGASQYHPFVNNKMYFVGTQNVTVGDSFRYDVWGDISNAIDTIASDNMTFLPAGVINFTSAAKGNIFNDAYTVIWINGVAHNAQGYVKNLVWSVSSGGVVNSVVKNAFNITWFANKCGVSTITTITKGGTALAGVDPGTTKLTGTINVHPMLITSLTAVEFNATQINLAWTKQTGDDKTLIRYRTDTYPTSVTDGTLLYNGTGSSTSHTGITPGQHIYYSAWGWNTTAGLYSLTHATATGKADQAPSQPTNVQPTNNSLYKSVYNEYLNVTAIDLDGETMTVSFYWSNGTLIHTVSSVSNNTQASIHLPAYTSPAWLTHDTTYHWYANITDTYSVTTKSNIYNFHTSKAPDINEDGEVNYLDVSVFVAAYGTDCLPGEIGSDINNDGTVNYLDASTLVYHYSEHYYP